MSVNEIVFQQDTADRKYWFKAASFAHPAKMVLGLQLYLIEHYTKKGDTILDPMAGSGTILVACAIGRNVICVELEEKFVKMQHDNWEKIQMLGPMLGYTMGQAQIIQGDARQLDNVLADKIISSPPYFDSPIGGGLNTKPPRKGSKDQSGRSSKSPSQIGAGKYDKNLADCAIFSPPFAMSQCDDKAKQSRIERYPELKGKGGGIIAGSYLGQNSKDNIAALPYGSISAVISSPPYENAVTGGPGGIDWSKATRGKAEGNKLRDPSKEPAFNHLAGKGLDWGYSRDQGNIGNLKSDSYLEAMLLVYQGCFRVLKPEGLMILVTKNFIRNKTIVRLDSDTIKLCEQAGFTLKERLKRKLTQMSFWRRIYMQKYPSAPKIEHEDILIFRKRTIQC